MATSSRRSFVNDPNVFCYICGEYTLEHNQKLIIDFVKQAYLGIKSTAKMQEYILITDVSLNTYSIFRAKKKQYGFTNLILILR